MSGNTPSPSMDLPYYERVFSSEYPVSKIIKDPEKSAEFRNFLVAMPYKFGDIPNIHKFGATLVTIYDQLAMGDFQTSARNDNRVIAASVFPGMLRQFIEETFPLVSDQILRLQERDVSTYPNLLTLGTDMQASLRALERSIWSMFQIAHKFMYETGITDPTIIELLERTGNDVTNVVGIDEMRKIGKGKK